MANMFFKKNKIGIVLTILILLAGSVTYFYLLEQNKNNENVANMEVKTGNMSNLDPTIFENMEIKVAYTPEGSMKLFVNARNNDLAKLKIVEGNSIPEKETIVIGYDEAKMMKEENLFTKPGDKIENLFGINVTIGGILNKTETIIDDMHFISLENYNKLEGEENKIYIKLTDENVSKVFYNYPLSKNTSLNFKLTEGNMENYKTYEIIGKTYYPLVVGFKEAKMMKEEKLFEKSGDKIEGFFGKDVIIIGIIEETNTSLDMMHLIPLTKEELN